MLKTENETFHVATLNEFVMVAWPGLSRVLLQ